MDVYIISFQLRNTLYLDRVTPSAIACRRVSLYSRPPLR